MHIQRGTKPSVINNPVFYITFTQRGFEILCEKNLCTQFWDGRRAGISPRNRLLCHFQLAQICKSSQNNIILRPTFILHAATFVLTTKQARPNFKSAKIYNQAWFKFVCLDKHTGFQEPNIVACYTFAQISTGFNEPSPKHCCLLHFCLDKHWLR